MGHSSLLGIDEHNPTPRGHDTEALGPSDSSDSGSDVAGLEFQDDDDPAMPADVAMREDSQRPETSVESVAPGLASDMAGTGERRSAGGDGGAREAADISPDRIIDPRAGEDGDDEDVLLTERVDDLVNVADDSVDGPDDQAEEEADDDDDEEDDEVRPE